MPKVRFDSGPRKGFLLKVTCECGFEEYIGSYHVGKSIPDGVRVGVAQTKAVRFKNARYIKKR